MLMRSDKVAVGRRGTRHGDGGHAGPSGRGIVAGLTTIFDVLVLNLVLLVGTAGIVTLPVTVSATVTALERWRVDGEDRVLREFVAALRSRPLLRGTVAVGVPLLTVVIAGEEVHFFAGRAGLAAHACLGLGVASLVISLASLGYVFVLTARHPSAKPVDLWALCARLALRNVFTTGPLFLVEVGVASFLVLFDTPLVLVGVPVLLLQAMRLTAQLGIRRSEQT